MNTDVPAKHVTIVEPRRASWLVHHAACELAEYVRQMTGARVSITGKPPRPSKSRTVLRLAIGPEADRLKRLPGAENRERLRDGFIIRSSGRGQLTIAAAAPQGLLYGVYEYLERFCGVGFFWDGEYVPELAEAPTKGIKLAIIPRWPLREFSISDGYGLAKYQCHFRTLEERRATIDWMARRKINLSLQAMAPNIAISGECAARVFDLDDTVPDNYTVDGYPGVLDFPAKVRTELNREFLTRGRQRGIRFIYGAPYGHVPHQFRERHPERRYVGNLYSGIAALHPDDPECDRWTRAFQADVIRTYGTDHMYHDVPYAENVGADDREQSFEVKLWAALRLAEALKAIDPDAIWSTDTWDITFMPHIWSPERIARYFRKIPRDMMLIYDTWADRNPSYKAANYYEGARWGFAVLHSFQGDDHLHGDMPDIIRRIQSVSRDRKAWNCQGIYVVSESIGHNLMYFDLITQLAWSPDKVTLESYLRSFARRRYGREGAARLLPALRTLARAVYRGGGHWPIYRKLGCHNGPAWWWPLFAEKEVDEDRHAGLPRDIALLRRTVRRAWACRDTDGGNPLYVTDLLDWTRTYVAAVFNWAVLAAYQAFKAGALDRIRLCAGVARECLRRIEDIIATRPEYSLQAQIERCMSIPGTNPYLPWYMKKHAINFLYATLENYEQMHWFYAPRIDVYLRALEDRAARGLNTIHWADVADECAPIDKRWLDEDIAVPAEQRFAGTTLDAIRLAVESVEPIARGMISGAQQPV